MSVGEIIFQQMGGYKFIAMTGAYSLTSDNKSFSFRLPRNKNKIVGVAVELEPNDTYKMSFVKSSGSVSKGTFKVEKEVVEDVYCDMLQDIFLDKTGLYTSCKLLKYLP